MRSTLTALAVGLMLAAPASAQVVNEIAHNCQTTVATNCEFVEIALPSTQNVANYTVVVYNADGTVQTTLPGTSLVRGRTELGYTFYTFNFSGDYLSNTRSAFALVNSAGQVVDFLSYGGAVTATQGPAAGQTSVDTGIVQDSRQPSRSIARTDNGFELIVNTPGRGNPGQTGGSLPVELVAFNGVAQGRTARLTWTTASETNNAGFVVERQTGEAWTAASSLLAGAGTTTERRDYAFTVTGLTAGTHTFRLRQIDTDGAAVVTGTVSVEIGLDGNAAARVTVLGNGFARPALRLETASASDLSVAVYDVVGRTVFSRQVRVSGTEVVDLGAGLASGPYVVRVTGAGLSETARLVVR